MILPRPLERTAAHELTSQQALLVVSPEGRIQFATARATRWLKDFSFSPADGMPQTLAGWLEQVLSSNQPSRLVLERAETQLSLQIIYRESKSICLLLEQRAKSAAPDNARGPTRGVRLKCFFGWRAGRSRGVRLKCFFGWRAVRPMPKSPRS